MTATPLWRLAEMIAGSPHNLVSRGERSAKAVHVHLAESIAVGTHLGLSGGERWVDLGTGGGIPGLALATVHPDVEWLLVDSVAKKARAVEEFSRALGLRNVTVISARAESLARDDGCRGSFDGVVCRAVAPLVVLVELARGFVRERGLLAAVKGPAWPAELAVAQPAMDRLGWVECEAREVVGSARPTWLVTMRAAGAIPDWVPRPDGVPGRRPLLA